MGQEGLRVPYRVDRIAWGIAVASLLAVAAVISLLGYLSFSLYKNLYVARIQSTVATRQYKAADKELDALFRGPPILGSVFGGNSTVSQSGKDTIAGLIQIMGDLSPQTLSAAKLRIESLRSNPALSAEFPPEAVQILKKLEHPLDSAAQLEARLQKLVAEKTSSLARVKDARTQFDLLAKDTAELFSLPADSNAAQGDVPAFYKDGVLADLPSLQGLPDGIASLEELKSALARVGGGVHLQGENVQQIFASKLSELRTSGASLNSALESAELAAQSADRQISAVSADLDEETKKLAQEFDIALQQLLETISGTSS